MASTNKTAHYEFPQYIGSDIPNILTDINPAFETIDTALYEQGQQIAEQTTDLSDIQEAVEQATADVAVMQSSIVAMGGILETTRQLATDNKETIGQGTLDTTAQTLIGAANELNAARGEAKVLVSYSAASTETWAQALTHLFNEIDNLANIPFTAKLVVNHDTVFTIGSKSTDIRFYYMAPSDTRIDFVSLIVGSSSYRYADRLTIGDSSTGSDQSSAALGSDILLEIVV